MLDERGRLLLAALGFAGVSMPSYDRALHALRTWLDSWAGIGRVAVGMARQGLRSRTHPVRREGLESHLLLSRFVLQRLPRTLQQTVQAAALGFLHGGQEEAGKILTLELP